MAVAPGASLVHPCVGVALAREAGGCSVALLATTGLRAMQAFSLGAPGPERPPGDRVSSDRPLDAAPVLALLPPAAGAEPAAPLVGASALHRGPDTGRAARPPPIAP